MQLVVLVANNAGRVSWYTTHAGGGVVGSYQPDDPGVCLCYALDNSETEQ